MQTAKSSSQKKKKKKKQQSLNLNSVQTADTLAQFSSVSLGPLDEE
jgi:hypothetical protein